MDRLKPSVQRLLDQGVTLIPLKALTKTQIKRLKYHGNTGGICITPKGTVNAKADLELFRRGLLVGSTEVWKDFTNGFRFEMERVSITEAGKKILANL